MHTTSSLGCATTPPTPTTPIASSAPASPRAPINYRRASARSSTYFPLTQTQKVSFFEEVLLNSDVIIYDLNDCDLKEAEFVISTLKIHPFKEDKILICISNVMTWASTPPKEKK